MVDRRGKFEFCGAADDNSTLFMTSKQASTFLPVTSNHQLARYLRKSSFREVLTKISFLVDFTYICIRTQNPKFETDQGSIHLCNVSFYAGGQNCKITKFEYEVVVYLKLH